MSKQERKLECFEPYCKNEVVAFDTIHPRLYCAVHLKQQALADLKYHQNLHYEFISKVKAKE